MECPSDDTLLAYKAKLLDADGNRRVGLHIESCARCRNLFMAWMRAENESAVYNSGADMVGSDGTPLDEVFKKRKTLPPCRGATLSVAT